MTRQQLQQIKEIYDMLEKGLTHPLKATEAFLIIQPGATFDTPMRVKQNTIQRFMMLSYREEYDAMVRQEKIDAILPPLQESLIGTIDNLPKQSHKESPIVTDIDDIQNFLTKSEKQDLKEESSGTELVLNIDGKIKSTRSPKAKPKGRTQVKVNKR